VADSPAASPGAPAAAAQRARQKRTLVILATFLIVAGLVVLFALERIPLPLRILMGLTNTIAGAVLLLVARQKFSN
jgi:multidrug efflux pump subunit AcrB